MSTFVVLWNRNGKPVEPALLHELLAAEVNPFNDGDNFWLDGSVSMAHQHFWITPEEVGENQPIKDMSSGCVFTGVVRLDNRIEVIRSLRLVESDSQSLSDAQLILRSYLRWGLDCPDYLLGDYAFVIWDPSVQRLFACRDPLGAEDLYYYLDPNLLVMSTSILMVLKHPDIDSEINEIMISQYLAVDLSNEEYTFYNNLFHLPPAHRMVVTESKVLVERYWDVNNTPSLQYTESRDYAERYRDLLKEAITCRARSTYPVGVSLSGGLDSSALTCLLVETMSEQCPSQDELFCYSYVFEAYPQCDERSYIDLVIEQADRIFPTTSKKILGDEFYPCPMNDDWIVNKEDPFQDPYIYLLSAVLSRAQKDGCRILFNGFFGDDLYSGEEYLFADLCMEGQFLKAFNHFQEYRKRITIKRDLIDYGIRGMIPSMIKRWYRTIHPVIPSWKKWIHPNLAEKAGLDGDGPFSALPKFKQPGRQIRYQALFATGYALGVNIYKRIARRFGMVYQFPYFDRRIVEFFLSLPPEQIGVPGVPRKILRESMANFLPEAVRLRKSKAVLDDLYARGIYQEQWHQIGEFLDCPLVTTEDWVREDWLRDEISQKLKTQDGFILWLVLSLELWMHRYWIKQQVPQ